MFGEDFQYMELILVWQFNYSSFDELGCISGLGILDVLCYKKENKRRL